MGRKRLEWVPDVVATLVSLRLEGQTLEAIAQAMRHGKRKPPRVKKWTAQLAGYYLSRWGETFIRRKYEQEISELHEEQYRRRDDLDEPAIDILWLEELETLEATLEDRIAAEVAKL